MSLLKKLAGETALYGLSSIVGRLLNFLLVPVYSRTLSTAENGVINELFAYSAFLMVVYTYRMESAFFRFGTANQDRERAYTTGLGALFTTTTITTAAVLLFSQPLADALHYSTHPEYIRYFALILAFDCLAELPFARLRLEQRPRRFVVVRLINIILNISLTLFWLVFCPWAVKNGQNWVQYVWSPKVGVGYVFLANVIASGATLLMLLPQLRLRPGFFDGALLRKMAGYAAPLILVQFAGIVNGMFDRASLKWLLPGTPEENLAQVGIYGNNYKLAMLITIFTQAYRYAAEPFFFRHAGDENAPGIQAKATKWFTITATLGMLGVLLFLDVVKHFLAPVYWVGLHLVPILLLSNVLLGVYYNLSVWYRLKDKTRLGALISLGGAALTMALNVALIPVFGYTGAAWTALATYAFMCFATWHTGRRYYPVPYEFGRMALYIAVAFGLFAGSQWLGQVLHQWPVALWTLRVLLGLAFLVLIFLLEKDELRRHPASASAPPAVINAQAATASQESTLGSVQAASDPTAKAEGADQGL